MFLNLSTDERATELYLLAMQTIADAMTDSPDAAAGILLMPDTLQDGTEVTMVNALMPGTDGPEIRPLFMLMTPAAHAALSPDSDRDPALTV